MGRHICNICGATFRRAEHLTRHKLSHADHRPFTCSKCDLTFSRKDTLQRHLSVHNKNDSHDVVNTAVGRSKRAKRACQKCSQTKLRCDGSHPCARCLSKGYACLYNTAKGSLQLSNMPQVDASPQQNSEFDGDDPPSSQQGRHALADRQFIADSNTSPHFLIDSFADSGSRHSFDATATNFTPTSAFVQAPCETLSPMVSDGPYQGDLLMDNSVFEGAAFDLPDFDASSMGPTAPHTAFWDDPQFVAAFFQGSYSNLGESLIAEQANSGHPGIVQASSEVDDTSSELGCAPVPSFLGARTSPEPQYGQNLSFVDFLRRAWPDQDRKHNSARQVGYSDNPTADIPCPPPLMGTFSPMLSSVECESVWESEDLAHVSPLSPKIYACIVDNFKKLNTTNSQYNQFVGGDFPSIVACNAFMQLFFEEFNQFFPIIHEPSFDPDNQHWLLILALLATGCRYSQQVAAVECADILQELVRRAFQATVEKHYGYTCEPWLAQTGLLNQIGMQFSADFRLTEVGQSMRSLIASIGRKVNCFNGVKHGADPLEAGLSCTAAWKSWAHRESMSRLAYGLWLVDCQYVLFHDLPPVIPIELLRVRLPSSENLWRAATADAWLKFWKDGSKFGGKSPRRSLAKKLSQSLIRFHPGTYQPLNIRQELIYLYEARRRRRGLGDFATLLLLMGVFRGAMQSRHSLPENIYLQPSTAETFSYGSLSSSILHQTISRDGKAMEYLKILCSDIEEEPRLSSLRSAILHHYHAVGIILGLSLGELFCYIGFRVTRGEMSRCRNRLRQWIQRHGAEARQVVLHAGLLFGHIRKSNKRGYYEGRAFMIACQAVWIYGELCDVVSSLNTETTGSQSGSSEPGTVRLDQNLSKEDEQFWILQGASLRPYLAGVGCILGADGVSRLIQEGSRVLCSSHTWGFFAVMGQCLRLWQQYHAEANL